METLFWPAFNLSVFLGFLVWKLRPSVGQFLVQRSEGIKKTLSHNEQLLASIKQQSDKIESQERGFSVLKDQIETEAKKDLEQKIETLNLTSQKEIAHLKSEALQKTASLHAELKRSLFIEGGDALVDLLEKELKGKLTDAHRRKMRTLNTVEIEGVV